MQNYFSDKKSSDANISGSAVTRANKSSIKSEIMSIQKLRKYTNQLLEELKREYNTNL